MWKRLLLASSLLARALLGQEESPLIVDPPRVSMTVFTNWQEIKVVYTIRWLDGYRPLFDLAKPENMSFSPFDLDPVKSYKLELRNRRRYKQENYVDAVYYLRHVGEKKGEIVISEQTFTYVKEEPGKSLQNLEAKEFKAPAVNLRYDSVLTKNADDIMDLVDFGSFKKQGYISKGLAGGIILIFLGLIILLFKNPVAVPKKVGKSRIQHGGDRAEETEEDRLLPGEALKVFDGKLAELRERFSCSYSERRTEENFKNARIEIYQELKRLLLAHIPELKDSDTVKEIQSKLSLLPEDRIRGKLVVLSNWLEHHENILYGLISSNSLDSDIQNLRRLAAELAEPRKLERLFAWFAKFRIRRAA